MIILYSLFSPYNKYGADDCPPQLITTYYLLFTVYYLLSTVIKQYSPASPLSR